MYQNHLIPLTNPTPTACRKFILSCMEGVLILNGIAKELTLGCDTIAICVVTLDKIDLVYMRNNKANTISVHNCTTL